MIFENRQPKRGFFIPIDVHYHVSSQLRNNRLKIIEMVSEGIPRIASRLTASRTVGPFLENEWRQSGYLVPVDKTRVSRITRQNLKKSYKSKT